jgi:hypothetical protein
LKRYIHRYNIHRIPILNLNVHITYPCKLPYPFTNRSTKPTRHRLIQLTLAAPTAQITPFPLPLPPPLLPREPHPSFSSHPLSPIPRTGAWWVDMSVEGLAGGRYAAPVGPPPTGLCIKPGAHLFRVSISRKNSHIILHGFLNNIFGASFLSPLPRLAPRQSTATASSPATGFGGVRRAISPVKGAGAEMGEEQRVRRSLSRL